MSLDARPFLTLRTAGGGSIRCGRPELRPLALGVADGAGVVAQDNPTHRLSVYAALGTPPADLTENAVIWVDVEPGRWQAFRILRAGIERGAGVWKLHIRQEEGGPQPAPQPAPEGYEP